MENTTNLPKNIKTAISKYAQALASCDAKIADLYEHAVRAYVSINTYEELKEANSLFNEIFVQNALAKGVSEDVARNRAKSSTTALRARARKYGWVQPPNPKTVERPKNDVANPSFVRKTKATDAAGNTVGTSVQKIVLTDEMVKTILSFIVREIPNTVFHALLTKEGKLRPSVLKSTKAAVVSEEIHARLDNEIQAIINRLNNPDATDSASE